MKAIERDSNYLRAHGSYMEDYRDDKGNIWRVIMPVSECVAKNMLITALMAEEMSAGRETYVSTLLKSEEDYYLLWLRVGNKDLVITHVDDIGTVYGLTNRDGRMYVITGEMGRLLNYAERQGQFGERLKYALNTLQYDIHDKELHLRCLF